MTYLSFLPRAEGSPRGDLRFPSPIIIPLLLSPKVSYPPSFNTKSVNLDLSPDMCLEQSLSKYHSKFLAFRHTYNSKLIREVVPN